MMKLELKLQNDWLEATWYTETITVNDVEKQVGVDEDEQPIMETVQEETVTKTQVHCESFSGHIEHIAMLRAKALEFGTELDEALISECIANFKYPTEEELAQQSKEQARQEALATIAQLEASQLRSIRELMLDANNEYAKAKLADIEAKIQEERAKL